MTITLGQVCQHCGHIATPDKPVKRYWFYVGGQGDVLHYLCEDGPGCWARWDKANGVDMVTISNYLGDQAREKWLDYPYCGKG